MMARLRESGPIAWMARNSVAANLLMLVMIIGGLLMMLEIKQEYLPATEPDTVTISVALPGATPEEVEQSIVLAIEEQVRAVQGVEDMTATAAENGAQITLELGTDLPRELIYNDIQQAVDQVTSLPEDAEEPEIKLDVRRRGVIEVQLFGDTTERSLRLAAEHVRRHLLQQPEISQVDFDRYRAFEVQIEIPQATLRAHDLTLEDVAATIRESALDRGAARLRHAAATFCCAWRTGAMRRSISQISRYWPIRAVRSCALAISRRCATDSMTAGLCRPSMANRLSRSSSTALVTRHRSALPIRCGGSCQRLCPPFRPVSMRWCLTTAHSITATGWSC